MTDPDSPIAQFHRYERPTAVPVAEREKTSFERALESAGIDPAKARSFLDRSRAWARRHPGRILGGLALALLVTGLIRSRMSGGGDSEEEDEP